ncbi:MAG: hemolysin family protein, partial [Candidatus Subteraquimicrobiales bacterium]|nr:hemolysin family protein [Candidatus Subteraquimicrobiales bacterium]
AAVMVAKIGVSHPVAVSTGVVTFIILVFGEITPKSFAVQHSERIALLVARPISFLCKVLYPIAHIFVLIANGLIRLIGGKSLKEGPFLTEEEIKVLVSVGEEEGVIEEEEKEMIHSIFEFGDTIAREVMVPRMDVVTVESDISFKDVLDVVIKEGHSRIPVYEGTVDNIIGIVYARDLLTNLVKGKTDVSLRELIKEAYYVPESKRVSELLRELQRKRQHMAIVVDEYGGTAGLITMEDLLEEIVGEIFDEYELEETMIEHVDENTIRVNGRVSLDEVNELLSVNLPSTEIETVGGFVYNLFGKIPVAGEEIAFENLVFKVEKVERRRIYKILITKKEANAPEEKIEVE